MPEFFEHKLLKKGLIEKRLYQEILTARVLENGNSLIVAPTALGKTIVAVLLSAQILGKEKGKILFLAPTKPLAVQHQKSFRKFMKLEEEKIALLTGTTPPEEREEIWGNSTVVTATPQTIENDLISGRIKMDDVLLCIFDEAHRSVGDYAYVYIAQQYLRQGKKPLVLALTASPGSEKEKIQQVCKNLFIENIEIKTEKDFDVKPYSNEIEVDWRKVDLPEEFREIQGLLEGFIKEQLEFLKKLGCAKTSNVKYYGKRRLLELQSSIRRKLIDRGKSQPSLFAASSKCAALMKISHAHTLLETQGINSLNDYFERMEEKSGKSGAPKALKNIFSHEKIGRAIEVARKLGEKGLDHPKKEKLREVLLKQFEENPESKVIVFNHYRDSIKNIAKFLNKEHGIKASKFIGQAAKGTEKGMTQKEQTQTIEELKDGTFNTLVASSVAEEGLDIPAVDLVVFYEPVPSEIRFIQRRGRTGRMSKGNVIILMAKNTRDEAFYWSSVAKERKMHKTLNEMKKDSSLPKRLDSQTTLIKFNEDIKDQIILYADSREQASSVTKLLKEKGGFVKVKQLEVGDFVITDEIVVERKTVADFLESMLDGRLFSQLINMASNYARPMLILEGNPKELFALRNIHRNSIIGALTAIAVNYRIPILFTENEEETAEYIYVTAKREQLGKDKDIRLRIGRKGLTLGEQQRFIVESLPLVGPNMAKKLLEKFGSVEGIFTAKDKVLKEVENLGDKKAKQIRKVIESRFGEEKKD